MCQTCHISGGSASGKALPQSSQALPWPGLPSNITPSGTSHRWDSSTAGHVTFMGGASTNSTGTLTPGGAYTGAYAKVYMITITNEGNVGTARFNWSTTPFGTGAGTNIATASTPYSLDEGESLSFANGTGTSFRANDKWYIYVRPDIQNPTNPVLLLRMTNGFFYCSTCHDQHNQVNPPFDPLAPAYAGTNTGAGRHYMRITNDTEQLCVDCHAARNVTNDLQGSHVVGVVLNNYTGTFYQATTNLPLEKGTGKVRCLTCHKMHFASANDGDLLRKTNSLNLCVECHILADTATPAAHFSTTNNMTLWPGGQYGTTFPQRTNSADQGTCVNCHIPHGWPVATNTASHYPFLLVDYEDNLCMTCHDTNGPAIKQVQLDFAKTTHHPVSDAEQKNGRTTECLDCHNTHKAQIGPYVYTNIATSLRNRVSNPIKGVSGVTVNYSGLTNWQTVATNLYTFIPKATGNTNSIGATNEYQICFKCHTGYSFGTNAPAGITAIYTNGTIALTNGSATVTGTGTSWQSGLTRAWIRTVTGNTNYQITNFVSATSLGIAPAYTGPNVSGQAYVITLETDIAQEFSPYNKSGHPIIIGLDGYSNSATVGGRKGLLAGSLKVGWTNNIGQQTMACSDCHNTDAASPAAQGPHGSAAQFMLRGPNVTWPNTTSFSGSFCANCHNDTFAPDGGHGGHHGSAGCYACHIVIPHGGRMSRLIGDRETMPARYAWQNNLANMQVRSFIKTTTNGYGKGNCSAQCTTEHPAISGTTVENW